MHGPTDIRRAKADRKRAYRALVAGGGGVLDGLRIRDLNGLVELLMETRWLRIGDSEDKVAIAAALAAMVDELVAHNPSRPVL